MGNLNVTADIKTSQKTHVCSHSINIPVDAWPAARRNQAIEPAVTYLLNFLEENVQIHQETSLSYQSARTDSNVFAEHKRLENRAAKRERELRKREGCGVRVSL